MDPVEVFGVGPDGELIEIRSRADRAWNGNTSDHDGPEQVLPTYRARPGLRPGGYEDRMGRSGGQEDVMTPVAVLPGIASRALHSGVLFERPIPGLSVDQESLEADARGSTWKATVECGRFRRRPRKATLRAYPTPSLNLTILELVPTRPRLIHTRSFVTVGVEAIVTLSERLIEGRAD